MRYDGVHPDTLEVYVQTWHARIARWGPRRLRGWELAETVNPAVSRSGPQHGRTTSSRT